MLGLGWVKEFGYWSVGAAGYRIWSVRRKMWECEAPAELMLDRQTRLGRSLALPPNANARALVGADGF